MQEFFSIHKPNSVIHHIKKLKNKNHMIILIDAGKLLTKFNTQDVGIEGTYLNIMKAVYAKPTANIILSGEKLKAFPL